MTGKIFFLGFRILQTVFIKKEELEMITISDLNVDLIKEFQNLKGFDTIERIKETVLPFDKHLKNKEGFLDEVDQFMEIIPKLI